MSIIVIASALFALGFYGVLTRRDIIGVLASVEVMLGGALVLLVAMATTIVRTGSERPAPAVVGAIGLMVIVVAAAEASIGLALLVTAARRNKTTRVDEMMEVRG